MFRHSSKQGLTIAWMVALIATLGSIYYSNWLMLLPCTFCWFQRVCLFPLVLILGLAAWRGCTQIIPYVLPQICLGFLLALIHLLAFQWPVLIRCENKECLAHSAFPMPLLSALVFAAMGIILWLTYIKHHPKNW